MKWKKYWGIFPLVVFSCFAIKHPRNRMFNRIFFKKYSGIGVILVWHFICFGFHFWLGCMLFNWNRIRKLKGFMVLRGVFLAVFILLLIGTMYLGMIISAFKYRPEHIVERNGILMVASVNSFLQKMVYYYEYKNLLFHGTEQIGWEDYGNGSGDPLERGEAPGRWFLRIRTGIR